MATTKGNDKGKNSTDPGLSEEEAKALAETERLGGVVGGDGGDGIMASDASVIPAPTPIPVKEDEPPPLPAVPKRHTMMFRVALDLLPGWVGAFKDRFAQLDPGHPPSDEEIAAAIVAGVAAFEDKDEQWRAIHP